MVKVVYHLTAELVHRQFYIFNSHGFLILRPFRYSFFFGYSFQSIRHPDVARLTTALLPDLIIALAKHYEFIGPSVDRVCAHNAAVALRFGQSFVSGVFVLRHSLTRLVYTFREDWMCGTDPQEEIERIPLL